MMRRTFAAARRRNPYVGGSQSSNIDLVTGLRAILMQKRAKVMAAGTSPAIFPSDEAINRFSTFDMVSVTSKKPGMEGRRFNVPQAGGLHYWLGGPGSMYDQQNNRPVKMPKSGAATWTGKGWEALAALANVGTPLVDSEGTPYSFQNLRPFDPASGVAEGTGIWSAVYETLRAMPPKVLKEELEGASLAFEGISDALRAVIEGQQTLEAVKPTINNLLRIVLLCIFGTADAATARRLDSEGKIMTVARQKEASLKGGAAVSVADLMGQMGGPAPAPPRPAAPPPPPPPPPPTAPEQPAEIPLPAYARETQQQAAPAPAGGRVRVPPTPKELIRILEAAAKTGMSRNDIMKALDLE